MSVTSFVPSGMRRLSWRLAAVLLICGSLPQRGMRNRRSSRSTHHYPRINLLHLPFFPNQSPSPSNYPASSPSPSLPCLRISPVPSHPYPRINLLHPPSSSQNQLPPPSLFVASTSSTLPFCPRQAFPILLSFGGSSRSHFHALVRNRIRVEIGAEVE